MAGYWVSPFARLLDIKQPKTRYLLRLCLLEMWCCRYGGRNLSTLYYIKNVRYLKEALSASASLRCCS